MDEACKVQDISNSFEPATDLIRTQIQTSDAEIVSASDKLLILE